MVETVINYIKALPTTIKIIYYLYYNIIQWLLLLLVYLVSICSNYWDFKTNEICVFFLSLRLFLLIVYKLKNAL